MEQDRVDRMVRLLIEAAGCVQDILRVVKELEPLLAEANGEIDQAFVAWLRRILKVTHKAAR